MANSRHLDTYVWLQFWHRAAQLCRQVPQRHELGRPDVSFCRPLVDIRPADLETSRRRDAPSRPTVDRHGPARHRPLSPPHRRSPAAAAVWSPVGVEADPISRLTLPAV